MGLLRGRINWGANQYLAPSAKRGKIRVCRTICNLIGQKHDTWSDWHGTKCKPLEKFATLERFATQLVKRMTPSLNWNKNRPQGFVGKRKSYQQSHQRRFKNHMAAKLTVNVTYRICLWTSPSSCLCGTRLCGRYQALHISLNLKPDQNCHGLLQFENKLSRGEISISLQYNCGAMDCTSLLKRKVLGSIPSERKFSFSSIFLYFLTFYNNPFFPNFVGNIITYLK